MGPCLRTARGTKNGAHPPTRRVCARSGIIPTENTTEHS